MPEQAKPQMYCVICNGRTEHCINYSVEPCRCGPKALARIAELETTISQTIELLTAMKDDLDDTT